MKDSREAGEKRSVSSVQKCGLGDRVGGSGEQGDLSSPRNRSYDFSIFQHIIFCCMAAAVASVRCSLSNGSTIPSVPRATPTAHSREEDVVRGLCAYVPGGDILYLFVQVPHLFALDAGCSCSRSVPRYPRSSNPPPAALASHRLASSVLS